MSEERVHRPVSISANRWSSDGEEIRVFFCSDSGLAAACARSFIIALWFIADLDCGYSALNHFHI
jgi:hypothetical protein